MIHSVRFIAVLDTNVIYPIEIRDLLFWFAYYDLYTPKWSEHVFDEWKDVMIRKGVDPEVLANACNEYFSWCIKNPLKEEQIVKLKDSFQRVKVSKMRPFTLEGMCNFIDISLDAFKNYEKREDFVALTTRIRQIIDNHQLEGAAAGFLNPNIIARKLGLADKKDTNISGSITFLDALKNARIGK